MAGLSLFKGCPVRATRSIREIEVGDTGTVVARWLSTIVTVRWDKDGVPRRIHRAKLELKA